MRNLLLCVSIGLLLAQSSSCASIVSGATQGVVFTSSPTNASLIIDGKRYGTTPAEVKLRRKEQHTVRIELEGYEPYETHIDRTFNEWALGNILFGGLIGIAVDAATGALYRLEPKTLMVDFERGSAHRDADGLLYLRVQLAVDPGLEKIGQLTPTGR